MIANIEGRVQGISAIETVLEVTPPSAAGRWPDSERKATIETRLDSLLGSVEGLERKVLAREEEKDAWSVCILKNQGAAFENQVSEFTGKVQELHPGSPIARTSATGFRGAWRSWRRRSASCRSRG